MVYRAMIIITTTLLVLSCGRQVLEGYMPSEDALVLAKFEQLLENEGIEFTRDNEGFYSANDEASMAHMVQLGQRVLEIGPSRGGIFLNSDCASKWLQEYLSAAEVVYIIVPREAGYYLETTKTDFNSHMITSRYASFLGQCSESLNKTGGW